MSAQFQQPYRPVRSEAILVDGRVTIRFFVEDTDTGDPYSIPKAPGGEWSISVGISADDGLRLANQILDVAPLARNDNGVVINITNPSGMGL